ncbi:MAG: hypothetical protein H7239_10095 [Flavobacterium sp.]|nr:hypothetical protein [Flavobacterium sp.]
MILPHPESDLNLNLMVVGSDIVEILKKKGKGSGYVLIESILIDFLQGDKRRTPDLFVFSLIFLFSVGLIDRKDYKIKLVSENVSEKIDNQIKLFT